MKSASDNFWNQKMETLSGDALRDIHQQKLLKQVDYVYHHSPFYRKKLEAAGIDPGKIKKLEDIVLLPFTEKKELRDAQMSNAPVGEHRACSIEDLSRVYSSSGTTGIPTYIGLTAHDIYSVQAEALARFCWAGGIRPGSIVVNIPTAPFIADTFREGIEKTGAVNVPTGFNTDRVISAFQYQKANAIHATISFWSYLLGEVEKKGLNPKELGLRTIIGGAEGGAKALRPRIEEGFGATATEGMGMGEMTCIVFGECVQNRGHGMHFLTQGLVHVELIDPETGQALDIKQGAQGELVYTALESQAMPLLRYRSRDHVRIVSTDTCVCGRTGFRIEVLGRTDDMLTILGVNVYPLAVMDVIETFKPRVTGKMEIQLDRPGPVVDPPLRIKVEYGPQVGDKAELKRQMERQIREKLIFQADIQLVDELPVYQYKRKMIKIVEKQDR